MMQFLLFPHLKFPLPCISAQYLSLLLSSQSRTPGGAGDPTSNNHEEAFAIGKTCLDCSKLLIFFFLLHNKNSVHDTNLVQRNLIWSNLLKWYVQQPFHDKLHKR